MRIKCNSILHVFTVATLFLTAACKDKVDQQLSQETSPYALFQKGNDLLQHQKYKDAARYFEQIEREHPASDLAPLAQIRHAFGLYESNKPEDAIIVINEFIQQYPVHPNADYMYYLKSLCYYDQIVDVGRDQQLAVNALDSFDDLMAKFPESIYVKDSKLKRDYAFNSLAGKEMEVAYYYLGKNDSIAAINRYKSVITTYQTSIFTPEALFRLTECYAGLGIAAEAKKYAAVLGANYPQSKWYNKAYTIASKIQDFTVIKPTNGIIIPKK
jgi:outer membrane protein assembly factor BamD